MLFKCFVFTGYLVILNEDYISPSFTLSFSKGRVHSNAFLVYIYSPGGVYPHYLCIERDAFWVYHYPVNGLLWTTTLNVFDSEIGKYIKLICFFFKPTNTH